MSTPAAVWKHFCRFVESKHSRKFGDLASLIERCALFEFTDEQIGAAQEHRPHDLTEDDPHPIPPFPFPEMCVVGSGGLILLRSPLMNEGTGVLEFQMMMFRFYSPTDTSFQAATCVVDSTAIDDDGQFPMELRDLRGMLKDQYWDEVDSLGDYPRDELGPDPDSAQTLSRADRRIAAARAAGDHELADKVQRSRDDLVRLSQDLADAHARFAEGTQKASEAGVEVQDALGKATTAAFYLGLQEVNWINRPDHYTVETHGSAAGRKQKNKRLQRLGERARHIVLTKGEIIEGWHRVNRGGTHASPIPHLRRGHYKTLRSARYKEKQGQRIWVRATHVGGSCVEWRDGDVSYKVV